MKRITVSFCLTGAHTKLLSSSEHCGLSTTVSSVSDQKTDAGDGGEVALVARLASRPSADLKPNHPVHDSRPPPSLPTTQTKRRHSHRGDLPERHTHRASSSFAQQPLPFGERFISAQAESTVLAPPRPLAMRAGVRAQSRSAACPLKIITAIYLRAKGRAAARLRLGCGQHQAWS